MPIPESMTESHRETAVKVGALLDRVMRLERIVGGLATVGEELVDAYDGGDIGVKPTTRGQVLDETFEEMRSAVAEARQAIAK